MGDGETMYSIRRVCPSSNGQIYERLTFTLLALDEIISQIMENSNSSHPVPATEEVMEKLDRTVLEEGCMWACFTIHQNVTDRFRL